MPELPEVETIKRQLDQKVVGFVVKNIEVKNPRSFLGNPKRLSGLVVQGVSRRAKMIIISLSKPTSTHGVEVGDMLFLLIHLKMTGQLIYSNKFGKFGGGHPTSLRLRGTSTVPSLIGVLPHKHTHVIFEFTDGSHLYFNDVRKFGWIKLVISNKVLEKELANLGPEPLNEDFTVEILKQNLLKRKNTAIKVALMDLSIVAGIGNIYAAEVCFYTKIRPNRKILTLSDKDFENLFEAIKKILPLAIKYQGVSADNYVTLEGKKGDYYKKLWVYDREGEPCPNKCGGVIVKTKLGGRGTYFCPACQK